MLYCAAAIAIAMLASPESVRAALASSASALVEATPFVLAGIVAERALRGARHAIPYLGCGCAGGPSALSLPAAAAAWLLFGPLVAVGRYAAALTMARALRRWRRGDGETPDLLAELSAMLPAALIAGAAAQLLARVDVSRLTPVESALIGAALGFAAPCGIGAIAVAGALRAHAPVVAVSFLCIAGIADARALRLTRAHVYPQHDVMAYALLATALTVVASRRGDALVHPAFCGALWLCAAAAWGAAVVYRRRQHVAARVAPGLMLAAALAAAPSPVYRATETTMTGVFAGERLTFAGVFSCGRTQCALERYAITCCRADAAPIAVRVDGVSRALAGSWLRVDGRIERAGDDLQLVPQRVERIAPPLDPFVYR